ncbi:MAG TPA: DUF4340 domain-containing protein [Planctomycetota bacterium]|nr:DUF4340 domain-containing protein [Planctomycetota bacterium]
MSFKTTVLLVVLVLVAAAALKVFGGGDERPADPASRRFFPDLVVADVVALKIDDPRFSSVRLERTVDGWRAISADPKDRPRRARTEIAEQAARAAGGALFLKRIENTGPADFERFGLDATRRRSATVRRRDGVERRLDFGAETRDGVTAAALDGKGPISEVDSVLLAEIFRPFQEWTDDRLLPVDVAAVKGVRVGERADGGPAWALAKESARWLIREPAPARADQAAVDRLAATLCTVETAGPWVGPPPAGLRLALTATLHDGERRFEVGRGLEDGFAPIRLAPDGAWDRIPVDLLARLEVPPAAWRSRRLIDAEPTQILSVRLRPRGGDEIEMRRAGGSWVLVPPAAWRWFVPRHLHRLPSAGDPRGEAPPPDAPRPSLPALLDPSSALRLAEGVAALEASEFGGPPPAEIELEVVVRYGTDEASAAERTFRLGPAAEGRRAGVADGAGTFAVRATDSAFLFEPFYRRLARIASETLPHCITEIEVITPERKAELRATAVENGRFRFELRRADGSTVALDAERTEAIRSRLAALSVREFVDFPARPEHGLDAPRLTVRFKDTVQDEAAPDLNARGDWIVWRVGAKTPEGLSYGEVDLRPGLIFTVEPRDLDPVIDLLNL